MGRPKKNKAVPLNLVKKIDPYAAKVVLRELYAKGVFVIKGSPDNEDSQKTLEMFVKSQATNKEYNPLFERFLPQKKLKETDIQLSDRLIAEASVADLQNLGFTENMGCLEKILANIAAFFGHEDSFFKKLEFTKILSVPTANGSIQDLHLDFCPETNKGETFREAYSEYFKQVEKIGCPHLSALHFPSGGTFSYMQGDMFSLNASVLKSLECLETDFEKTVFFKKLKNSPNERRFHGILFPVLGCSSQVLNLPPNTTVLFRQCLPHQEMNCDATNVRISTFIQCSLLREPVKFASVVRIPVDKDQWLSTKKMEAKGIMLPSNRSNLKTILKKYKKL